MSALDENLSKAQGYLFAKFRETGVMNHIAGASVPANSGKTFETISPVDGSVLAQVAKGGAFDIDAAVAAAKKAFVSWSKMPGKDRKGHSDQGCRSH